MLLAPVTSCFLLILLLAESWITPGCESPGIRTPEWKEKEGEWGFMQVSGTHSLCLNLTVKSQSSPGQPWCDVQGSADKTPLLQYDSDSLKVKPLGRLGETVNATKAWTELTQTLGEVGQELRMILSVTKLEENRSRGPPTLGAKVSCHHWTKGCSGMPWQFSFNGQIAFLFDPMSMNWMDIDPAAREIKENWEDHKGLAEYFRKISVGDCCGWLRGFLEHWVEVLEPTVSSSNSSDTQHFSVNHLVATIISTFSSICLVLIVIIVMKWWKRSDSERCL